ncbi:type II toxin-antitoxin system RelE/ParE family toxin [bacterium]|nr:type II toxin-antitoxin system RelE/ParE family toxin [bacterium]
MRVVWTPRAIDDLDAVLEFISRDNPLAARRFAAKLKNRANSLRRFPRRGVLVPERGRDDLRELVEGNYKIAYEVTQKMVRILAIYEGHRLRRPEDYSES